MKILYHEIVWVSLVLIAMYVLIIVPSIDFPSSINFVVFVLFFYDALFSFIGSLFGISRVYSIFCCKPGLHVAIHFYTIYIFVTYTKLYCKD